MKPKLKAAEFRTVIPKPRTHASRLAQDPGLAFYGTNEWRDLRAAVVKERGYRCEECGCVPSRVYLDHVEELRDGGAPLDRANLMLRCGSCHTRKSGQARARRLGIA
jgi:hypothetical protein